MAGHLEEKIPQKNYQEQYDDIQEWEVYNYLSIFYMVHIFRHRVFMHAKHYVLKGSKLLSRFQLTFPETITRGNTWLQVIKGKNSA